MTRLVTEVLPVPPFPATAMFMLNVHSFILPYSGRIIALYYKITIL